MGDDNEPSVPAAAAADAAATGQEAIDKAFRSMVSYKGHVSTKQKVVKEHYSVMEAVIQTANPNALA